MGDNLFKISDLVCAYDGLKPVLKIDNLVIKGGQLVVIVGKSGAGKSTILETLGLMNNTVRNGKIIFCPGSDKEFDFSELWKNEDQISDVRNFHMSFIFQNTNLMANFTAYENACIPQLLQGVKYETAVEKISLAMKKVGLDEVSNDDHVVEMSGGQRQRLAFVRAITPDFSVLFGDEPTGNLDEYNSTELMRVIKSVLEDGKKTSIVVSHNIDLSLEFADQIIMITKENGYGEIRNENIFISKNENGKKRWFKNEGHEITDLKNLLQSKLR